MQRPYTASPGTSLTSISLYNSTPIRGIVVDNPSGGWLYIVEVSDFCPPYTTQWSRDLEYAGSAISVRYGVSPGAGQLSTVSGNAYTVTLYSSPVGNSIGLPQNVLDTHLVPTYGNTSFELTPTNATDSLTTTFLGGSLTKRLRVYTVILNPSFTSVPIYTRLTHFVTLLMFSSVSLIPLPSLWIGPNKPSDTFHFDNGFDYGLGEEIFCQADIVGRVAGDSQKVNFSIFTGII